MPQLFHNPSIVAPLAAAAAMLRVRLRSACRHTCLMAGAKVTRVILDRGYGTELFWDNYKTNARGRSRRFSAPNG
jgi:hypothetical protein